MSQNEHISALVERHCSIGAFHFLDWKDEPIPDFGFPAAAPSLSQFSQAEERNVWYRSKVLAR